MQELTKVEEHRLTPEVAESIKNKNPENRRYIVVYKNESTHIVDDYREIIKLIKTLSKSKSLTMWDVDIYLESFSDISNIVTHSAHTSWEKTRFDTIRQAPDTIDFLINFYFKNRVEKKYNRYYDYLESTIKDD